LVKNIAFAARRAALSIRDEQISYWECFESAKSRNTNRFGHAATCGTEKKNDETWPWPGHGNFSKTEPVHQFKPSATRSLAR